jgi:cyclohexadieny/prephenate dehydrogenase
LVEQVRPRAASSGLAEQRSLAADKRRIDVLQFAACGFRDLTRIAASDPVMWRDIFLNNREALLEMLTRFMEDAQAMSRAVRWGDAAYIEEL